jgi:hypothetical protein
MSARNIRHCTLLLFAALACVVHDAIPATKFQFDGTWRITRIVGYSEVSVSPGKLQQLIGQTVNIGPGQLRIGSDDCVPDTTLVTMHSTKALLLDEYRAGPADAGVADRTLVLDAGRCGHVFRVGPDIVVYSGGAFYRAVRIRKASNH